MENENKYIFLEDFINSKYEDFNVKLKSYGYYAIDGDSRVVKYEHETNKSEICIFMTTEEEIYVDFYNSKRDVYSCRRKVVGLSWYLGKKDSFNVDDIFEVLNNEEFKKFVLPDENITLKQYILNIRKDFFDVLKTKYDYEFIVSDNNTIDFVHKSTNMILSIKRNMENLTISFNVRDFIWSSNNLYDSDFIITDINTILYELETEGYKKFKKDTEDRKNEYRKNSKLFSNIRIHKGSDGWEIKSLEKYLSQNNQEQQTQTQKQIDDICKAISDVLIDKNKKYGNSAIKPINVFYKGDNTNSILIRLDDKLSRIKNNKEDIRVNDICDTIGYLVLLLVVKGVKIEDIEKLKD